MKTGATARRERERDGERRREWVREGVREKRMRSL